MFNQPATTETRGTSSRQADRGLACGTDVEQLVAEYHAALYRYAYRLSGSSADAEDLTQQTFLVAYQKLDQVRSADCVRSWLYAVLRNCYLRDRRQLAQANFNVLSIDLDELPEQVRADEIDREQIQNAINELPEEYKLVVLMFYFEDCTYRDIAERLELPIGTVMSRLSRAKGHLRGRLLAGTTREPSMAMLSTHRSTRHIHG